MRIYQGKLNYSKYAIDENIVLVFPCGLSIKDPVCAFWKWTIDSKGVENGPNTPVTHIDSSSDTPEGYQITFHVFNRYYQFTALVTEPHDKSNGYLTLNMRSKQGVEAKSSKLKYQYSSDILVPCAEIYTGMLNYLELVRDEMVTLIFPRGIHAKESVHVYFNWTEKSSGEKKIGAAMAAVNVEHAYKNKRDASEGILAVYKAQDYTFHMTVDKNKKIQLSMENSSSKTTNKSAPYALTQKDQRSLRTKKALIVRCHTGVDGLIFKLRDTLVDYLAFNHGDIELLYYDHEEKNGKGSCTKGQQAPTAAKFKETFAKLISSAAEGEVCFIYVDAPPHVQNGENNGWLFAQGEDGSTTEAVKGDWIASTIHENLKSGVNLTILASTSPGNFMLDAKTRIPGVLMTGCSERQKNIKVYRLSTNPKEEIDPWTFGLIKSLESSARPGRGIPTYESLFIRGRKFIKDQMNNGNISSVKYLGPSDNENNPKPMADASSAGASNQDPQMLFLNGYINVEFERFCCPFGIESSGRPVGEPSRYPKDEM